MKKSLAIITGGTSGIGLGIARTLATKHDLALAYAADHKKAAVAVKELKKIRKDLKVSLHPGVLKNHEDAQRLVAAIREQNSGEIGVLVNCAGRVDDALFVNADFASQEKLIMEHLVFGMALTHLILPRMYKAKSGRIVNISSVSARYARRGQTGYAAAKAGLDAFTRTLALEVAHRGITVNAVAPGLIETPMTRQIISQLKGEADLRRRVPARFAGTPDDVGALVEFLCSDAARYITGAVIPVDGGSSLGAPDS